MSLGTGFGLPMCVATNDHYWRGGSVCSACGTRLRCGCGLFVREDDLDRHVMSGECRMVPGPAPCWPGECDATCEFCVADVRALSERDASSATRAAQHAAGAHP